jgi:hypothetical protein
MFGCFVDIRQQDGQLVRMHYEVTSFTPMFTAWVGINEKMADKFISDNKKES